MRTLFLIGTRPEAIKMAPLILAMRHSSMFEPVVCSTGQHREMLDSSLADFGITPEIDLSVMKKGQTLCGLAGRLFTRIEKTLEEVKPSAILVQGDTTTALAGAIAGFYSQIPVGHIEAGLRSGDMKLPYPEEFNRRAASLAATWHFAPTEKARKNLLAEGIAPDRVFITGNTVVDALVHIREEIRKNPPKLPENAEVLIKKNIPYVLVTSHRRENFGSRMEAICEAIAKLANAHPDLAFIYPVHLNPAVQNVVRKRLQGFPNIALIPPCNYRSFLRLLDGSLFALSDSGGVQEEAPSFGKKALVMRDVTERPEGVEAGYCRLVGTQVDTIIDAVEDVLKNTEVSIGSNPYGDGHASERIITILENHMT